MVLEHGIHSVSFQKREESITLYCPDRYGQAGTKCGLRIAKATFLIWRKDWPVFVGMCQRFGLTTFTIDWDRQIVSDANGRVVDLPVALNKSA